MRALHLVAVAALAVGCADDSLPDTAYRRLVDGYGSYDECVQHGQFADCYQTLTFCADGTVRMTLNVAHEEGTYQVQDSTAVATFLARTVMFDLASASSPQLPGQHPWEVIDPVQYDCAP